MSNICANYKSVKWVLLSLNFNECIRVFVRERMRLYPRFGGYRYLGGGYVGDMIQRYGDRLVVDSCILEDALILYVAPLDFAEQQTASGSAAGADVLPE